MGFQAAVLTNVGAEMLAMSQAGHTLTFTRIDTGNGIYIDKSISALKTRTSLMSEKQSFSITGKQVRTNEVRVSTLLSNEDLEESYYLNEVGLFAKIDTGAELLYSLAVTEVDNTTLFEKYNGETPVTVTQSFVVKADNTAHIEVIVPTDAYALASDLDAHVESLVSAQTGVHGIRYYNGVLSWFDVSSQQWTEIQTGSTEETAELLALVTGIAFQLEQQSLIDDEELDQVEIINIDSSTAVTIVHGIYAANKVYI